MYRKNRRFSHKRSISPEKASLPEDDKSYHERMSYTSKKSISPSSRSRRKSVAGSELTGERLRPGKWLKGREYLLLLIEASLSLAVYVIRIRNVSRGGLTTKRTSRQVIIYMHYAEGYSALVSMFIGCIADSWLKHYTVALFSVILHFAAICVVLMEEIVENNQQHNPYTALVWNVSIVALVLIRSTDFTRLVYGLEGITNRRKSTIFIFIFLQFWVSSYATYGGLFLNVGYGLFMYLEIDLIMVSFVLSALSLFLFVYVLHPEEQTKEHRSLGCGVVGCLLLATYYKIFRIQKQWRRGFFGNTEGTFKKTTISRTKEILLLYALLLPALGIAFKTMIRADIFYHNIREKIKPTKYLDRVGLPRVARAILSIGMLTSYFVMWPLLTLLGLKDKQSVKFLVGHLLATLAFFYSAILTKSVETWQYPVGSGFVRVFNTRGSSVRFITEDRDFTTHDFDVQPRKGEMLSYPCSRPTMFAMGVEFNDTKKNFTMFLSVVPYQTVGYMVLEPPEVVRIRGPYLPLREGPPGTNQRGWPKIFIYNTAKTLEGADITIKYAHNRKTLREVAIQPGIMTTIDLSPALYDFSILRADIRKIVNIQHGGSYGMMIYATTTSRGMAIDTVIGPNTASAWPYLGMYFVVGLANGICYPALRAMIFSIAPQGLMAMSFAFLVFLEGFSLWIVYIGCRTWHYYVTGDVLFGYASCLAIFFLLSTFVLLKYNHRYT